MASEHRNLKEERLLVNRAKWLLVYNYGITEEDAYHFIRKLAMDNQHTKAKIAKAILNNKELVRAQ